MTDAQIPRGRVGSDDASWAATFAAAAMIAHQVSGKAARDTLFLDSFHFRQLPWVYVASALLTIFVALGAGATMRRLGPGRWVPPAYILSAALHLAESLMLLMGRTHLAAVILYLHMAIIPVLISAFWSVLVGGADPRANRRQMARAALSGCAGGVVGGTMAWSREAAHMLPLLAMLHLFCAGATLRLRSWAADAQTPEAGREGPSPTKVLFGRDDLRMGPYLGYLAVFVTVLAAAAAFLDYYLKAQVQAAYAPEARMHFFSAFYSLVALMALVVQFFLGPLALRNTGLATTAALLPCGVVLGGVVALVWPRMATAAIVRGSELVIRNSLFRFAYEPLFTAVPPRQRKALKTVVDVGFERTGDLLGGAAILVLQSPGPQAAPWPVAWAMGLAGVGLVIARFIHVGYRDALRKNLAAGLVTLEPNEVLDSTTLLVLRSSQRGSESMGPKPEVPPPAGDSLAAMIAALGSDETAKVRRSLTRLDPMPQGLIPHVLPLLGRDDVADLAVEALRGVAAENTGQLVDRLLDPKFDLAARRRVPKVLVVCRSTRAVDGLMAGLEDPRFEVRLQCGRALARMFERDPGLPLDKQGVLSQVSREIDIEREVWKVAQPLQDDDDPPDSVFLDERLRRRATRSLEHVFNLLSLVLPREPLLIAFRALHTDERSHRGIALEYLDSVLPRPIRNKFLACLEVEKRDVPAGGSRQAALEALIAAHESIEMSLTSLHRISASPEGSPPP